MPVKRSQSETSNTPIDDSTTPPRKQPKKSTKSSPESKGTPKARLAKIAKIVIAEHIIHQGAAAANVDELIARTGLTRQQVRSQLVDNRQNVRKQLLELAQGLQ